MTPVQATIEDIRNLIREFTDAAIRAKKAGFDGIEIHGAHFYLLSQFISPLTNTRTDQYGGDYQGRAALPVEIVKEVRNNLGPDFPIFFRLNAVENAECGLTPDESIAVGKLLVEAGVDVLDLSLTVKGKWKVENNTRILMTTSAYSKTEGAGGVTELAGKFKAECGIPVIAIGKLNSKKALEQALDSGADMVAIGRQMICDPDTVGKILAGNEDQIVECEACMGCFASLGKGSLKCKNNANVMNLPK